MMQTNLKNLLNLKLYLSNQTKLSDLSTLKYIYGHKKKIDMMDLNYTLYQLKLTLPLMLFTLQHKLPILIMNLKPTNKEMLKNLKSYQYNMLTQWAFGLLTNFNEMFSNKLHKKIMQQYPNLIILTSYHQAILNEMKKTKHPSMTMTNTSNHLPNTQYFMMSNNQTQQANTLFLQLLKKTMMLASMMNITQFKSKSSKNNTY